MLCKQLIKLRVKTGTTRTYFYYEQSEKNYNLGTNNRAAAEIQMQTLRKTISSLALRTSIVMNKS